MCLMILRIWVPISTTNSNWKSVLTNVVGGITNIFDAWNVVESKVISRPTPIWGGFNGILVNKNFHDSILLLTSSDGVTTCLIVTSTNITMVTIGKWRGIHF